MDLQNISRAFAADGGPHAINRSHGVPDEVAERIREWIFSGMFKPGERLPSEISLAQAFGVSRSVVREALRGLEQLGVIVVRRGYKGGAFVTRSDMSVLNRSLAMTLRIGEISITELFEARLIYEPEVARLAALRAEESELSVLRQVLSESRVEAASARFAHPANLSFHQAIARATKNPILEVVIGVTLDLMRDHIAEQRLPEGASSRIFAEHEQIYAAIRDRDASQAARLMREHVLSVWEMLRGDPTRSGDRVGPLRHALPHVERSL